MAVTPDKQIFYCFGCGAGGNVINFIMKIENLDFIDAVKFLAERARIDIPEFDSNNTVKANYPVKQDIYNLNKVVAKYFNKNLYIPENKKALEYLLNRKLDIKTINNFGLGYAKDLWDDCFKYLLNYGFDEKLIVDSGICIKKSGKVYDRFRNRIIFPIIDVRGNVIGFGGRVLDDSLPKYLNSPETYAFNKRNNLYGLNFAKNSADDKLIIVEGYMDVITLQQAGFTNTVASLGTALSEEQARLIRRYCKEAVICYDSDLAGQAATLRGLDILYDAGCNVKVLTLEGSKDPDEYIKERGALLFKSAIDKSKSLIEYKIDLLKGKYNINDVEEKIKFANELAIEFCKIDNNVERDVYINKIADETNIAREAILSEVKKLLYQKSRNWKDKRKILSIGNVKKDNRSQLKNFKVDKLEVEESTILNLICYNNKAYRKVAKEMSPEDYSFDIHKRLAEIVYDSLENNEVIDPVKILSYFKDEELRKVTYILHKDFVFDNDIDKVVDEILSKIDILNKESKINNLLKNGKIEELNSLLKELKKN
jgi:DNA primase